jgi:hypothetical protein
VTQQATNRDWSSVYNKWEVIQEEASQWLVALTAFPATSKPMVVPATWWITLTVKYKKGDSPSVLWKFGHIKPPTMKPTINSAEKAF